MTAPGRYVLIDASVARATARGELPTSLERLKHAGWRPCLEVGNLLVLLAPNTTLPAAQVHRRHILIGDYRGPEPISNLCGRARSAVGLAADAVDWGWGRYLLAWRDDDRGLCVLRDPSGALDAVWWTSNGATVVTDAAGDPFDALAPDGMDIDWPALATVATDVARVSDTVPLAGVKTLLPGTLTELPAGRTHSIWTPDRVSRRREHDDRPAAMAEVIDRTVEALVSPHQRILTEISGGLDSAIVAASLTRAGLGGRAICVNYHVDQAEGDERAHARSVAAWLGLPLTEIRKPPAPLKPASLSPLGLGFRPSLHGLDFAYETDVVHRLQSSASTGLLTGQGGDSLFFQAPDGLVLRDRVLRLGLLSVGPGRVGAIARWTRKSARAVVSGALRARPVPPLDDDAHPWLKDAQDLPPAKRGQIRRFVNAQLFWSDCPRSRAAELLHPLLSQPVVNHCLAIPTDRLVSPTTTVARDRALAREAFAGRLPPTHLARRDKGDLSRFYTLLVRDNRDQIHAYLGEGLLARQGWFDDDPLENALSFDRLVSDPASNRFLIWCVVEAWARHWTPRIERLRRPDIAA